MISARKAKQLDATAMFTYSHANTPLGQSEGAYYLSYFINDCMRYGTIIIIVVQFYPWFNFFSFALVWGMVIGDNQFETKKIKPRIEFNHNKGCSRYKWHT